jgi:hypothetical protein
MARREGGSSLPVAARRARVNETSDALPSYFSRGFLHERDQRTWRRVSSAAPDPGAEIRVERRVTADACAMVYARSALGSVDFAAKPFMIWKAMQHSAASASRKKIVMPPKAKKKSAVKTKKSAAKKKTKKAKK